MSVQELKCPLCGGAMVRRRSAHGPFWGCRDFPKCKGLRDSMGEAPRQRTEREADDTDPQLPSERLSRGSRRWRDE